MEPAELEKLVRETHDAVIEIRAKVDLYLGKDGIVDRLQDQVETLKTKTWTTSGFFAALGFVASWIRSAVMR